MEFIFRFYIKNINISNICASLEKSFFKPEKFDSIERAKKTYYLHEVDKEILTLYQIEGMIFIKGCKRRNTLMILNLDSENDIHLGEIIFKTVTNLKQFKDIVEFIKLFLANNKIIFGYLAEKAEFAIKHRKITYFEDGGSTDALVGCNLTTLMRQLPGIYHITIFSETLVHYFNLVNCREILNANIIALETGNMMIQLHANIIADGLDKVLSDEQQIINFLGHEYFFDINKSDNYQYNPIINFVNSFISVTN